MASNPMKRKARTNFILGMLVMTLILGAVIALLVIMLMNVNEEKRLEEEQNPIVSVFTLNEDVLSGQIITTDMIETTPVRKTTVPSNAIGDISIITNYSLTDGEGNQLFTKYVTQNEGKRNEVKVPALMIKIEDKEYNVFLENEEDYYYRENNQESGEKIYLKLSSVPLMAKVDMNANTVITTELISKADDLVQDDVRRQEYNTVIMPTDLTTGDYVDIRLLLPTGQDYIVTAKKEIEVPFIGESDSLNTMWIKLTEEEILFLDCAIIDNFAIEGSKLYATKYTDPGLQEKAIVTYPPNIETMNLLQKDPNVLQKAKQEIINRYNSVGGVDFRNNDINSLVDMENVPDGLTQSITNSQTTRQEYLESIYGE